MKKVYILLTRSGTDCSRIVYALTRDEFTHASLAMNEDFDNLYSFTRKYKNIMLPAGFNSESVYHGVMGRSDNMRCAVYEIIVTDEAHERMKSIIRNFRVNRRRYRYNIFGLLTCKFNVIYDRKGYFFCSQFVYHTLTKSGAVRHKKHPSLVRPMELVELTGAREIFKGRISELRNLDAIG